MEHLVLRRDHAREIPSRPHVSSSLLVGGTVQSFELGLGWIDFTGNIESRGEKLLWGTGVKSLERTWLLSKSFYLLLPYFPFE